MSDQRIVVFGATGYTGGLVARALVAAGSRPVLAGRRAERLASLAAELGGLDHAVADAQSPDGTIEELLEEGDVLVSTVGPFVWHGTPALNAAIAAGATYLDSTGEPPFIRAVFEHYSEQAQGRAALITAFGYDFVPGNLAAALALDEAGERGVRVDIGYFTTGRPGPRAASSGTLASIAGVSIEPSFAWRDGRLTTVRSAQRVHAFDIDGEEREGFSVGGSEHLALPRSFPSVEEVNVYLGWVGSLSRVVQATSVVTAALRHLPGRRALARRVSDTIATRVTREPGGEEGGTLVVATAYDERGSEVAHVRLEGSGTYTLTGDLLAWGARRAAAGGVGGTGALGPVEAFGLEDLAAGCAEVGLVRV